MMVRFTLRLTQQQMDDVKALARKRGISVSAVVREAVDRYFIVERAKNAVGSFHSGLGDLSERHDDYLDEAYSAVKEED